MPRHRRHVVLFERYVLRALHRHPNGGWIARIRDMETGKVRAKWSRAATEQAARQEIIDWLAVVAVRERAAEGPEITIEDAMEEFLRLRPVRPVSLKSYRGEYERGLLPLLRGRRLKDIAFADVEELQRVGRDSGLSPRTISMRIALLRRLCRWARLRGYLDRDPTEGVRLAGSRRAGTALTVEEARKLMAHVGTRQKATYADGRRRPWTQALPRRDRLFLALAISLYTGIRRRTLLELSWRHVSLERHRLEIPAALMKGGRDFAVPLHPQLEELLRERLQCMDVVDLDAAVLGQPSPLNRMLDAATSECGLPHIRWHDLRHTFGTWLAERAPYASLQALLGHAQKSVTDRYMHVRWESLVESIRTLPDLLPGGWRGILRDGAVSC